MQESFWRSLIVHNPEAIEDNNKISFGGIGEPNGPSKITLSGSLELRGRE